MQLENLKTQILGRNVIHYQEIDSTQLEVWRQVEKNALVNGTIILADKQTKGKRNTWEKMVYRGGKQYSFFYVNRTKLRN